MRQQELETLLESVLGAASKRISSGKLTKLLSGHLADNPEGYIRWALETYGTKIFIGNTLYEPDTINRYTSVCSQEKADLIQHLYNAGKLLEGLISSSLGAEEAFQRLKEMVPPYVVFLLMDSSGFATGNLIDAAVSYYEKFPEAMKALPDAFKKSVNKIGTVKQQRSVSSADTPERGDS